MTFRKAVMDTRRGKATMSEGNTENDPNDYSIPSSDDETAPTFDVVALVDNKALLPLTIINNGYNDGNDTIIWTVNNAPFGFSQETYILNEEIDPIDGDYSGTTVNEVEVSDKSSIKTVTIIIEDAKGVTPITGNADKNFLYGGDGNDIVYAGLGNDYVEGREGNDSVYSEAGNDILIGGFGDDYINGGSGKDKLYGEAGNDQLDGLIGNDSLDGGSGDDSLLGWDGNDYLNGGDGDDFLKGEAGKNFLIGGTGDDILIGGDSNDSLKGGDDDDSLEGYYGQDTLYGDYGNDTLNGDDDDDYLSGGPGEDKVIGGTGDDELKGGDGKDTLEGGFGKDILTGGGGADKFYFYELSDTTDTITSFNLGDDEIQVSADGFGINEDEYSAFSYDSGTGQVFYGDKVFVVLDSVESGFNIGTDLIIV